MRRARNAFAYQCGKCRHLMSRHLWNHRLGGTLKDGPYVCEECGCSVVQDAPSIPLTRQQYLRKATP